MPIRWDNIGQTSGMYNASTLANRSATQQVNKGFDALQGVIDTQQKVSDGNYANTTSNNTIEVEQYLKGLGNQGVDAVQAAMDSGAIQNKIGAYGGQLSKEAQMLDGSNQLQRARTSANSEDAYNQQVAARVSRPLVSEWNALNSDPSKDAERDAFLQANKESLVASGDFSRMFDKAKATDRTELDQGYTDQERSWTRNAREAMGNMYAAREEANSVLTPEGLKQIAVDTGMLDPETGKFNPNATTEQKAAFRKAKEDAGQSQRQTLDNLREDMIKQGIPFDIINQNMSSMKTALGEEYQYYTEEEETEYQTELAAIDREYGTGINNNFTTDAESGNTENITDWLTNQIETEGSELNQEFGDSWFKDASEKEKAFNSINEAVKKGVFVKGEGKAQDQTYPMTPALVKRALAAYTEGDVFGQGESDIPKMLKNYVESDEYTEERERYEGREKALLGASSRRNAKFGDSQFNSDIGEFYGPEATTERANAERATAELKAQQKADKTRVEGIFANKGVSTEAATGDQYTDEGKAFHDAYSKWSNPENTGPDPQTLRADGTPKDLFGSFLTPEPGQDLAGNPINNDPAPVANNVSPAPVNNAPASEGISLKSYLPGGENSRVPTSMNALGTELTRTLTESPIGTAAAGMLTNAFQTEKSRAANQGNSIMQAVTTNNGRTINNLLSAATSTKKGLKQIASEAKKLLPEMGLGLDVVDSSIKSGMPKLMDNNVSSLSVTEIASLLTDVGNSKVAPYVQQLQKELALRKNAEESEFTGQLRNFAGGNGSQLYGG